jgi:hypothetical protein
MAIVYLINKMYYETNSPREFDLETTSIVNYQGKSSIP